MKTKSETANGFWSPSTTTTHRGGWLAPQGGEMYRVTSWDTDQVLAEYGDLAKARRECRKLGHGPDQGEMFTGYPPVAYVANEQGEVVYNPRFIKK